MTVIGKLLLLAGCTAFGYLRAMGLRQRTDCLEEFRRVLAGLARELSFSLRPMEELLGQAEKGVSLPTADFFRACRRFFLAGGGESWAESWGRAIDRVSLPLEPQDLSLLREAGEVLGRYDGESQRQALDHLLLRLEEQAAQARERAQRLFRVYLTLGVAAGLFGLILF